MAAAGRGSDRVALGAELAINKILYWIENPPLFQNGQAPVIGGVENLAQIASGPKPTTAQVENSVLAVENETTVPELFEHAEVA